MPNKNAYSETLEEDFNISSLVVLCAPNQVDILWEKINALPNAECHHKDAQGKIIVTLESKNIDEEIKLLKQIESLEGVISAQMIYAYHSKELQSLRDDISMQDSVPSVLLDSTKDAKDITYGGDAQTLLDNVLNSKKN